MQVRSELAFLLPGADGYSAGVPCGVASSPDAHSYSDCAEL